MIAVDDADNASAATTVSWTLDTVAPTVELACETSDRFNGSVAQLLVTATFSEAVTNFTASSIAVSNGTVTAVSDVQVVEDRHVYTVAVVPDSNGEVIVKVEAGVVADVAGNGNEASNVLTFIYDDVPPTATLTSDTPARFNAASAPMVVTAAFSEAVTNFTAESVSVQNGTVASVVNVQGTDSYAITVNPIEEGPVTVQIAAGVVADLAGNGNKASATLTRVYDTTGPTVTLSSDTRDPFNLEDVFTVKVAFDETVTNFTADCVTVVNGTATDVSEVEVVDGTNTYTVTISPMTGNDVAVSVEVQANAVADLAGNWNVASTPLTRTCDTERPTVTFSANKNDIIRGADLSGGSFIVTISFSEPVTNYLADAVTVSNGTKSVERMSDTEWKVTIDSTIAADGEGVITVEVAGGVLFDAAGNGNDPGMRTWIYDNQKPQSEGITISGTPENGATIKGSECNVELTASSTDVSGILSWGWKIYCNGKEVKTINMGSILQDRVTATFTEEGTYTVSVRARDNAQNYMGNTEWTVPTRYSWTFVKDDMASADVEFGGGICVKVDSETGTTNSVSFTAIDFRPGAVSTFTLSGFDVSSVQDGTPLGMWFVVSDTLGGPQRHVAVSATLDAGTKALTATLPAAATENKRSLFIIGIDNKAE